MSRGHTPTADAAHADATSARLARSVLGPVAAGDLGFVLPHEHLTVDNRIHHLAHEGLDPDAPVSADLVGALRVYPHALKSNLVMDEDDAAAHDLRTYRALGGTTLVELTPLGMGRDVARLRRLARETGTTIISGTGWYVERGHGALVRGRSTDDLADELVAALTADPATTGHAAGVIGEIGISREHLPDEWRVLDASLQASARTGAPIWIHQTTTAPMRGILGRLAAGDLDRDGVDRSRIVLCHTDYDLRDLALHREALALGINVELDLFGMPVWTRRNWVHAPTDARRTEAVLELLDAGGRGRLLISQDVCMKIQLTRYGGFGHGHLLAHVRELFEGLGGDPVEWDAITRTTPARLLAWAQG